ncbi:MAG TPA: sigma-70 family RNA polymerase sigma factor [Methylomirabilota bacterium]|nr:sigma-70 family RNA polymerase sigma factor [Methylomirabilota bacterium]
MTRMVESVESAGGSDAAAVERTLAGDADAFRLLVERHSRSVFRLAHRMSGNQHDAEEIVQEAFLRAYRKLRQFESRANFGTWVYRIAANCAIDRLRRQRKEEMHLETELPQEEGPENGGLQKHADERPTPERTAMSAELRKKIEEALAGLSAAERAAFVMRHWEGLGIEEIAAVLRLKPSAAKNTVFRAVQKLRQALEPYAMGRGGTPQGRIAAALGAAPGTEQ